MKTKAILKLSTETLQRKHVLPIEVNLITQVELESYTWYELGLLQSDGPILILLTHRKFKFEIFPIEACELLFITDLFRVSHSTTISSEKEFRIINYESIQFGLAYALLIEEQEKEELCINWFCKKFKTNLNQLNIQLDQKKLQKVLS